LRRWFLLPYGFAPGRHEDAEGRSTLRGIAFDDAAVLADDLGNEGQPQAGAVLLCGDKGIEENGPDVFRHARPIIVDAEFERKRHAVLRAGYGEPDAGTKGSR